MDRALPSRSPRQNRDPRSEPRPLNWDADPADVFAVVADRPGAIFLDSSTSEPLPEAISILAWAPERILEGNLDQPRELRCWLEDRARNLAPDFGLPLGGAMGFIDYRGRFTFGLYPRMLVFRHDSEQWFDIGGLAEEIDLDRLPAPSQQLPTVPERLKFQPAMSRTEFLTAVERAQDYIAAGDIYQVNLSQKFEAAWPAAADPYEFFRALRHASPAPYSAFLNLGDRRIFSSSPEQFLKFSGRGVQTRPIKGTRPRFRDPEADERSRYDLITSEKERAELVMITDLERNDLGQVCEFGSVQAVKLLEPEAFEHVHHLVSTVRGQLRPEVDHLAALTASFPGGSITGAPKKRAMEIIEELEPVPRGIYTGAIGYFGLNGESQFNIAIRTAVVEGDRLHFHVGAGIVADSKPEAEFEETLHKARGLFQAFGTTSPK